MKARVFVALCALICCSREAAAQDGAGDRLVRSLTRCREVAEPASRLDCFDKATSALEVAVKAKDVTILDRQQIRETRKSLFGFTLPRIGLFGGGDDDKASPQDRAELEELNAVIASVRLLANDRLELRLVDSEAVWVTTDRVRFPPKAGAKVRITRASLGAYFIAAEGSRPVRGIRLR